MLSIDSSSVAALEESRWRPFSGLGQEKFSLLGIKPEARRQEEDESRGGGRRI
jgi:hypothetical protein